MFDKKQNDEQSQDSKSRRRFLRNTAIGAAGASAALITQGRYQRVLARMASDHIDDFLKGASDAVITPEGLGAFKTVANQFYDIVETNPRAQATFDSLISYIDGTFPEEPSKVIPDLGISPEENNMLGLAFLRSLGALGTTIPSREQITQVLSSPDNILGKIEPGFLDGLLKRGNEAVNRDPNLAAKVNDAASQLITFRQASEAEKNAIRCYIGRRQVNCWLWGLVAVVVVVVFVALK